MVLVQASRLPKGLRYRYGSHSDQWLLVLGLACIPHFIAIILIHRMISIMDHRIPCVLHCYNKVGSLIYLHVRSPQGEVVTKKLHDQGAVLVGLFPKSIQFRNGFIKGLEQSRDMIT